MNKRKKVPFTVKSITFAVMEVHRIQQNKVYNFKRLAYKKANNLVIDFMLGSANLERYSVIRTYNNDKKNMTQDDVNDALMCVADFDIDKYKKLHLTLQHFVRYCSSLGTHGIMSDHLASVTNEFIDRADVIRLLTNHLNIDFVADDKTLVDSKCCKCGLTRALNDDGLCQECHEVLEVAIQYHVESFSVTGTCYRDFSTQIKNFKVTTKDNTLYTFEVLEQSTEPYEPFLPFAEYRDSLVLI